jgi:hypothetical protein
MYVGCKITECTSEYFGTLFIRVNAAIYPQRMLTVIYCGLPAGYTFFSLKNHPCGLSDGAGYPIRFFLSLTKHKI